MDRPNHPINPHHATIKGGYAEDKEPVSKVILLISIVYYLLILGMFALAGWLIAQAAPLGG